MTELAGVSRCPFCEKDGALFRPMGNGDIDYKNCSICGEYGITREFEFALKTGAERDRLFFKRVARFLSETRDKGRRLLAIDKIDVPKFRLVLSFEDALSLYRVDLDPAGKYEKTLANLNEHTNEFGQWIDAMTFPFIVPSFSNEEQKAIFSALEEEGLIAATKTDVSFAQVRLTAKGLARAAEIKRPSPTGKTVFVAASFAAELERARESIRSALLSLGYEPYLVNLDPHNDLIDMRIYDNIRKSRFMVADLTLNRQSVYYEVGFAHGLGLQVVLTCRTDSFEAREDDFRRVHFDLNHRQILRWDDEDGLRVMLQNHILMAFGRFP